MNLGAKVSLWSQRHNYATLLFFPLLTLLSVVSLVSVSTLKARPSHSSETLLLHIQNLTILVLLFPYLPCASFFFFFLCGRLENIPKPCLNLTLFLNAANRGWIYCVQASLSASHCKLCHMQMAIRAAIHPQLLSVVGSGARYRDLLPALTATTRSSSELMSSCGWLDVRSLQWLAAEAAPPRSWKTPAAFVRWLLMWGVRGCWQSYTRLLFFFSFPSLLNSFTFICCLHVFLHAGRPQGG